MIVGVLRIELFVPASGSLKTKRFAVKSIKDKIRARFNVSVAEVENLDKWQRATLAVAAVSNEQKHIESILDNVMKVVYGEFRAEVLETETNYY
jgi:uncharacterized protein YlxP (DUF503 family)